MFRPLARLFPQLYAAKPAIRATPEWTIGTGTADENPEIRFRRELYERLRSPITVRWLDRSRIRIFPNNELSRVVYLTGLYEPNEFLWLDRFLARGMTVIDAGANQGLYTIFAARRVGPEGRVISLEPSRREFDRLTELVRFNRLRNVRCRRLALSRAPGRGQLRVAAEWNAGHNTLGEFGYETTELVRLEEVDVRALDAIVADEGLQRVDLIKLDIEGAEYDALRGAEATIRRFRPAILVELADRTLQHQGASSAQIWTFLEALSYRLYAFDADSRALVPAHQRDYYDSENLVALAEEENAKAP